MMYVGLGYQMLCVWLGERACCVICVGPGGRAVKFSAWSVVAVNVTLLTSHDW